MTALFILGILAYLMIGAVIAGITIYVLDLEDVLDLEGDEETIFLFIVLWPAVVTIYTIVLVGQFIIEIIGNMIEKHKNNNGNKELCHRK